MYIFKAQKRLKFTHGRRKREYIYKCLLIHQEQKWSWWQHKKPNKKDAMKFLSRENRTAQEEEIIWATNFSD